jgi:hypothetical protein
VIQRKSRVAKRLLAPQQAPITKTWRSVVGDLARVHQQKWKKPASPCPVYEGFLFRLVRCEATKTCT